MNTIPLWVVASLGKKVSIKKDFKGAGRTYPAGSEGTLVSIQGPIEGWQSFHVTVAINPKDISYEENFKVDEIRPIVDHISLSLDIENGLMRF